MTSENNDYPLFLYIYGTDGMHDGPIQINSESQLRGIGTVTLLKIAIANKQKIIITDTGDCCVFHAEDGKIVWGG